MRPTYGLTNSNGTGVHPVSITADRSIWRRHFCRIPPRIKLDRILVLAAPKEGVPGLDFEEEMFYLVSSTAYGTKDAPRGWFKNLE